MNKTVLHWSYRDYRNIPINLLYYDEDLEEVYLKENFITQIPKWLLQLTNLKFIHLSGNLIEEIPTDIYYLENLEFLDVSNNCIECIPETIGKMRVLVRFNVSGNRVTSIPSSIGQLKKLEFLDISENCVKSLPIELSECCRLTELCMNFNPDLLHIPERISNMKSLTSLSAERCGLLYLPAAITKFLTHCRMFHNSKATHFPVVYDIFMTNYFDNAKSDVLEETDHGTFFTVRELETGIELLLPFGTRKVFPVPSHENQITLYDDALHVLNYINLYISIYNDSSFLKSLPTKAMGDHIKNGPIARCSLRKCFIPLYTSYYLMVVKRKNSTTKLLFTCNFCSMHCANLWTLENKNKYTSIDWEICDN